MIFNNLKLSEIIELIIDYRGKTPSKLGGDWSLSGYRVLSAKNIKTGKIVQEDSIRYVSNDIYRLWMKNEISKGDIIITSEAPFGEIFYWDTNEKIVLGQRLYGIRVKKNFDSKYIYYYMSSFDFKSELSSRATGTTVLGLRQPELLKCNIKVPSFNEQLKISKILSVIDKKIKLNECINDNLCYI